VLDKVKSKEKESQQEELTPVAVIQQRMLKELFPSEDP